VGRENRCFHLIKKNSKRKIEQINQPSHWEHSLLNLSTVFEIGQHFTMIADHYWYRHILRRYMFKVDRKFVENYPETVIGMWCRHS